jgi:hypothetical protein
MFGSFRDMFRNLPMDDEEAAIEQIAGRVVSERMTSAAILFLETMKPVSFLGGQAAIAATPLLGGFLEPMKLERYSDMLGNREFVERLVRRIEELEAERAGETHHKHEKGDTGKSST